MWQVLVLLITDSVELKQKCCRKQCCHNDFNYVFRRKGGGGGGYIVLFILLRFGFDGTLTIADNIQSQRHSNVTLSLFYAAINKV